MLLLVDVLSNSLIVAISRAQARPSFPSFTWERLLFLAKFYFALASCARSAPGQQVARATQKRDLP